MYPTLTKKNLESPLDACENADFVYSGLFSDLSGGRLQGDGAGTVE